MSIKAFDTRDNAIAYMVESISADLAAAALTSTGQSALWLSGGSTPIPLYTALAQTLNLEELTVGLVDERWVPETDPGSNAAMIKRTLLAPLPQEARDGGLIPMYLDGEDLQEDAEAMDSAYMEVFAKSAPIVILGMGGDGHTASWFPNLSNLTEIASATCSPWVVAVDATGSEANATTQRITLTGAAINACSKAYLYITGEEKRKVFEENAAHLPIHRMSALLGDRLEVVWAS